MTRPKNPKRCARENCDRKEENHGYCRKHMQLYVKVGYVDAAIVYGHIDALRERGYSLKQIAVLVECNICAVIRRNNKRFQAELAHRILSIPIPETAWVPDSWGLVSAVGTRRRIQALRFMGHTTKAIGDECGVTRQRVRQWAQQVYITSFNAQKVDEAFRKFAMQPGPSERARKYARAQGWLSSLSWDDIDNPDEVPGAESATKASFTDQYEDMQFIGLSQVEMLRLMGCSPAAFCRRLQRYHIRVEPGLQALVWAQREGRAA